MPKKRTPSDSRYFHYYNANPKSKNTCDCVVRALCGVLPEKTYEQIMRELLEVSLKCGYMINDKKCYGKYLEQNGFIKFKQPRKVDNTKYTGREFCIKLSNEGNIKNIFAHLGGHHVVAIVNNKVNDTWDSTNGRIGNFYKRYSKIS